MPASTYFLADENGRIYGAANIRHQLTDSLRIEGGHIGYGIRPSMRKQGYGTRILKLALEKVKDLNITEVLVTCSRENNASARVIEKNGGNFDSEVEHDNKITRRYWIR